MKKRILSILLLCCMVLTLLPTAAFAEDNTEESPVCTCETVCTAETMNTECSVCGADGALPESCAKANTGAIAEGTPAQALTSVDITFPAPEAGKPVGDGSAVSANADSGLTLYLFGPALWKQGEEPDKLDENAAYAEGNTYLLNFTFYTQKPITDETVLTFNGKPITRYADYPALTEALGTYDGTQDAYLGCVLFSEEGTGDPAMEDLKDLYLLSLYAFVRVPEAQIPEDTVDEQFTLTSGGTYYFDLSGASIPGTANSNLPDTTLHYVPFTYAGTIEAYKLTSATATTEEYAQQNKYPHSLFIADYVVTNDVSWDTLNTADLIFGKNYAGGGVDYTLRAPSVGSSYTGSGDSERGTPKSNEWDKILDKDDGYIKNWREMLSCGQDTTIRISASSRAVRGWNRSARFWTSYNTSSSSYPTFGFRPVLEVPNPGTLGADGLKAVTLNLGGGKLGGSSDAIHIIVKNGSKFTAPASGGLTRPAGDTGSYFMWLDSNGNSYAPGASVPADVTELTVQWTAPTYTVTLNAGDGTINSGNVTSYTYGVGATLPTDVTRTGYTFKGWYDNENLTGSSVTAIGGTEMGNKEYWAKWEINQYTITYDLAGGTVEGNPDTYTVEMDTFTLKNPTRPGYTFTGWSGTGLDGENNMTVTIPKGSTGERRYTAHWRYNGGSSGGSSSYPITVPSKTENGTVTVSPKSASAGSTVTITVKPDSGYVLETISVTDKNGNDLKLTDKGGGKYTFTMPASKVEVKATFMEDNSVLNFFYDVPNDAYYYEAVKWAAENGITGGVGNSLFAPNQPCTRAQIVTFLWRAAGSPVVNYRMPFTDVDEGAYYAEAVRWAASTGIVTGLTETTFGTDSVCTRAQAAAMIYRCAQAQGKGFTGAWMFHLPFTDVPEWAYESVAWCYMNGVTTGVNETAFAPGNDCTRAQIVTFLWRAFSK